MTLCLSITVKILPLLLSLSLCVCIQECSVLALVLDHLLPQCQDWGDKDCPALARVLIASLAACNHSADAQTALITELKAALQRALLLAESSDKHSRLQSLMGLISTVIEACPVPGQIPNQVFKGQQQTTMNNIVKILLRKGLVTDLARIPHSLDLASPNMANTINAALKPLETLSRIVNQPQTVAAKSASRPKVVEPESRALTEGGGLESATVTQNRANTQEGKGAYHKLLLAFSKLDLL